LTRSASACVIAALALTGCELGDEPHYTLAESERCFEEVGRVASGFDVAREIAPDGAAAVILDRSVEIAVIFMASPERAKEYVDRGGPPGIWRTNANAVLWGHQTVVGRPQVTDEQMEAVEECLA
jgi:hypothetical protein